MNNLKILIKKLCTPARNALEKSANFCISQQNFEIEIEHLLHEILNTSEKNDFSIILDQYKISKPALLTDLSKNIAQLPKGNTRTPIFAKSIVRLLEQAWLLASAEKEPIIRSSHLIVALLTAPDLYQIAIRASSLFGVLPIDTLKHTFIDICSASIENETVQISSSNTNEHNLDEIKIPSLDKYTINLTQKAKNGEIDPVIGREHEIRLMLDILMRRRQNNPILTGEPGVGKTAVVEGLALKIVSQHVPDALKNVQLHALDIGLLQAGASVKGEFENRLKQVIKEVQASVYPIILFIDEAHTLIGAGGQAGQNDAANLLKPALARGELRTIAATTWAEYKQFFEKDAALSRRFQVIQIEEPTEDVAIHMLRAMIPVMAQHFDLHIDDEAVITAVQASHRYITGRQLPDKAISVLDTAAARVALSQNTTPEKITQLQATKHNIELEFSILNSENLHTQTHTERLNALKQQLNTIEHDIEITTQKWNEELSLVQRIKALCKLESNDIHIEQIQILRHTLEKLQGQEPLVFDRVNTNIIHEIISDWTGIPMGSMVTDEIQHVLNLESKLEQRVMGQHSALYQLVQGIKTSKAKLEDPNKPQGVFLLVGPSGVGKTETALALANELYGGESHLITINMSEYQEAHTVSSLKGSPPGYVGYGQGGVLTEAVRRNPYSVVLLDEIEKSHPDVQELFYQVFDKGTLEDGEGRIIDFKNTTILLTSNTGSNTVMKACLNEAVENWPTTEALVDLLKPSLYQQFKPAFLGRMRIVPYFPLHDDLLVRIIHHKLNKILSRLQQQYQTHVEYTDDLVELLLSRCTEVDSGARNIDNILNASVLPELATHILLGLSENSLPKIIRIDIKDGHIVYEIDPKSKRKKASKTPVITEVN